MCKVVINEKGIEISNGTLKVKAKDIISVKFIF